tara:strand:- start:2493 stop:3314 length:822 start_codon:yes stop_codon:yes gene_type:complete
MDGAMITKWHYQLQNYNSKFVEKVSDSTQTMWIIDRDKTTNQPFTIFDTIKMKNRDSNILISYMSVGEAEDYRPYFKKLPKSLIAKENPHWKGNFDIKYWEPAWHQILYSSDNSYLDKILSAGFDGVYLDIVDGYKRHPGVKDAADKMAELVIGISKKAKSLNPRFRIYLQNGSEIINDISPKLKPSFVKAVDGLSIEGYFFDYSKDKPILSDWFKNLEPVYKYYQTQNKDVFMIEYVEDPALQQIAVDYCNKNDIKLLITDRLLKGNFSINN